MIKVLPINLQASKKENSQIRFKGSMQTTEAGTHYYKGNAGLIAGSIAGISPLVGSIMQKIGINDDLFNKESIVYKDFISEFKRNAPDIKDSEIDNLLNSMKRYKKLLLPIGIATALAYAGCGVLIDYLTNKKSKETADTIALNGVDYALQNKNDLEFTSAGSVYSKAREGSKYGALLGIGVGALSGMSNYYNPIINGAVKLNNNSGAKKFFGMQIISSMLIGALGGWIMGIITDNFNNRGAEKASIQNFYQEKSYIA